MPNKLNQKMEQPRIHEHAEAQACVRPRIVGIGDRLQVTERAGLTFWVRRPRSLPKVVSRPWHLKLEDSRLEARPHPPISSQPPIRPTPSRPPISKLNLLGKPRRLVQLCPVRKGLGFFFALSPAQKALGPFGDVQSLLAGFGLIAHFAPVSACFLQVLRGPMNLQVGTKKFPILQAGSVPFKVPLDPATRAVTPSPWQ